MHLTDLYSLVLFATLLQVGDFWHDLLLVREFHDGCAIVKSIGTVYRDRA